MPLHVLPALLLKGNQARTRADKSLAIAPYVQPAPLERAAWAAKLEHGPVPATCHIISRFRNSQTVKRYFRFFSLVFWLLKVLPLALCVIYTAYFMRL